MGHRDTGLCFFFFFLVGGLSSLNRLGGILHLKVRQGYGSGSVGSAGAESSSRVH